MTTHEIAERALAAVDRDRFAALQAKYVGNSFAKYLDLEYWILVNVRRAQLLGLDNGVQRRVVDLGCGCGYFLHVCRLLGHDVQGVDWPKPIYKDVAQLLGVPVLEHRIDPSSLPPIPPPYDVVTAHMVCFNGHNTRSLWGARDWAVFLDRFVGATLHLELNRESDGTVFPRGVAELFGERGGVIVGRNVVFRRVGPRPRW